jgi:hypothetical protein
MNGITAARIIRRGCEPYFQFVNSPMEQAMTNGKEDREASIAAITIALMLFFAAVSFAVCYLASPQGLLFDGGGAVQPPPDFTATKSKR